MNNKFDLINKFTKLAELIESQSEALRDIALDLKDQDENIEDEEFIEKDDIDLRWRVIKAGEGEQPNGIEPVLIRRRGEHPEFYVALDAIGNYEWQPLYADGLGTYPGEGYFLISEEEGREHPCSEYRYRLQNGKWNKQWLPLGDVLGGSKHKTQQIFRKPKYI